ncbi:MAG: Crp/Fnr family transcriptional regulator [bacterium]
MNSKELLNKCTLFAELDNKEITDLSNIAQIRNIKKKTVLFWEGDQATGFFLLLSGGMRIYKSSSEGKEYTLHIVRAGHVFAEAAIFKGKGYPANCVALEDSVVAFFPKNEFIQLLQISPHIALKIIGALSSWLRDFNRMIEELSLKEVPSRLASYLISESEKINSRNFTLTISKTQLATRIGTISETLSRTFRKFRDAEIIIVNGNKIEILNYEALEAIADGEKI